MSDFVPMSGSGGFRLGLVSGADGASNKTSAATHEDAQVEESNQSPDEDAVRLPSTPEELDALLEEVAENLTKLERQFTESEKDSVAPTSSLDPMRSRRREQ